ncbi:hypothetical protein CSP5_0110 [Cuniculiplasma divulgatum]|uniref:Uncharacterized protein n=1 Tax=Cuniculiplasma divulgatum TaxID=1673428 RepID=A0A1N5S7B3_9ARCH|nr:hypothetical protein CSP5_0110 [Cuniculiplasma divulgatum]SJK83976.1 hypothetical protein CPM_0079 [Cuniculiplasma divulgatum]
MDGIDWFSITPKPIRFGSNCSAFRYSHKALIES